MTRGASKSNSADDILFGTTGPRGDAELAEFSPLASPMWQHIFQALNDGTYWVNAKDQRVELDEINGDYAANILGVLRRRLQPEQYRDKPLTKALQAKRRGD